MFFDKNLSGKSGGNPPGNPPENRGEISPKFFVFFQESALETRVLPGKIGGKIGENFPRNFPNFRKFPKISEKKGSKMTIFDENDTRLHPGFWTRIFKKLKSKKNFFFFGHF